MMVFWRLLRIVTHPVALAGVAAVLIALGGGHYVRIRADLATAQEALQESRDNHVRAMAALAQRERELRLLEVIASQKRVQSSSKSQTCISLPRIKCAMPVSLRKYCRCKKE